MASSKSKTKKKGDESLDILTRSIKGIVTQVMDSILEERFHVLVNKVLVEAGKRLTSELEDKNRRMVIESTQENNMMLKANAVGVQNVYNKFDEVHKEMRLLMETLNTPGVNDKLIDVVTIAKKIQAAMDEY